MYIDGILNSRDTNLQNLRNNINKDESKNKLEQIVSTLRNLNNVLRTKQTLEESVLKIKQDKVIEDQARQLKDKVKEQQDKMIMQKLTKQHRSMYKGQPSIKPQRRERPDGDVNDPDAPSASRRRTEKSEIGSSVVDSSLHTFSDIDIKNMLGQDLDCENIERPIKLMRSMVKTT